MTRNRNRRRRRKKKQTSLGDKIMDLTFKVFIFLGIWVTLSLIFASIYELLFFAAIPLTIFLAYLYASPHARASFLRWMHLQPKNMHVQPTNSNGNQQNRRKKHHKTLIHNRDLLIVVFLGFALGFIFLFI